MIPFIIIRHLNIIFSQKIGAGDKKQVNSLITTSFVTAVLFSVILTIILEFALPTILNCYLFS
ncbi:MATE family efflux transporter [Oscillibacter sp.]|uniref:MATE family efflux transporter n=1 Tax=Oscillibacter sp. TaxID=1945593 RepID=UPI0037C555AA